jgi:hypothetical protein
VEAKLLVTVHEELPTEPSGALRMVIRMASSVTCAFSWTAKAFSAWPSGNARPAMPAAVAPRKRRRSILRSEDSAAASSVVRASDSGLGSRGCPDISRLLFQRRARLLDEAVTGGCCLALGEAEVQLQVQ